MAFILRRFLLRFDGSSKNPGPSGIGYTLADEGSRKEGQGLSGEPATGVINTAPLVAVGAQIGEATNNETEYQALISGLRHAIRIGMWRVDIESDSMLVVMQVLAKWKVRDSWLKRLHAEAKALLSLLPGYTIKHIPRELNEVADALSRTTTWTEPSLPPPLPVLGRNRSLHEWQAAFVYYHWRAGVRNSYFWGRIYDVDATLVEHVGNGETYKGAKFVGMPAYAYSPAEDDEPAIIENLS